MSTVTGGTPPTKRIAPGEHAPSGASVAADKIRENKRREWGQHYTRRVRSEAAAKRSTSRGSRPTASAPYNALNSPFKTQGQFDAAVLSNAKSQYQPELDQLNTEEQGEKGLHETREGENAKTYQQYTEQAQAAYDRAKQALGEIASRQNAGTTQGQAALQAALSNTGVAGLAAVPNPEQFTAQAAGIGNADSQALAGMQSGVMGEASKGLLIPGAGRAEAQFKEGARTSGQINKIGLERKKVLARVPDIQTKTRADMTKEEQAREANRIQTQLATGKLGLEKTTQAQNYAIAKQTLAAKLKESREANAVKIKELAQAGGFEEQKLGLEREKIQQAIFEAKNAKEKAAAELAGKRWDNGLQLMAGVFKINPKTEYVPSGDPNTDLTLSENHKLQPHKVDPMHLYNVLTQQGNLTAPEAFRIMGSTGNPEVEKFAEWHLRDFENKSRQGYNKKGGKQDFRTPQQAAKHPKPRGY